MGPPRGPLGVWGSASGRACMPVGVWPLVALWLAQHGAPSGVGRRPSCSAASPAFLAARRGYRGRVPEGDLGPVSALASPPDADRTALILPQRASVRGAPSTWCS
ncbi:unnamed protein product [Amoebophrya sp. A120]|nr:unnamed protein product [Amoebophrya sp. A120]|eukprot:GSA120T00021990001.1